MITKYLPDNDWRKVLASTVVDKQFQERYQSKLKPIIAAFLFSDHRAECFARSDYHSEGWENLPPEKRRIEEEQDDLAEEGYVAALDKLEEIAVKYNAEIGDSDFFRRYNELPHKEKRIFRRVLPKKPKALICDLDGVIIDSEKAKYAAYLKAMRGSSPFDIAESEFKKNYLANCVGKSAEENASMQLSWYNKFFSTNLPVTWQQHRKNRNNYYNNMVVPLIQGNVDAIKDFHRRNAGVTIYLVSRTGEERTLGHLKRAGLSTFTTIKVVPGTEAKYIRAADEIKGRGISFKDCVAIEDTEEGVKQAREMIETENIYINDEFHSPYVIAVPNDFTKGE